MTERQAKLFSNKFKNKTLETFVDFDKNKRGLSYLVNEPSELVS